MVVLYFLYMTFFMLLCVLLCGVILMQESKSTGLGASFGGDVQDSVFGTGAADVLKKFTAWLAVIFFVSCVLLSLWTTSLGNVQSNSSAFTMEHIES